MSSYEIATLIGSICAILISILIPLIQFIYKRIKRPKISLVPFETNSLNLFFNESGSYFKFSFCLACHNKPITISSIHAAIIRKSDKKEKKLYWSSLESVYINWFGSNAVNRINSVSYARPYRVAADTLEPFIVEFSNYDTSALQTLCAERDKKLLRFTQFSNKTFGSIQDLHNSYVTHDEYKELCTDFSKYLFWIPGDYEMVIEVFYDIDKKRFFKYNFTISSNEYELLYKNTESIVFGQLYKQANLPIMPFISIPKTV